MQPINPWIPTILNFFFLGLGYIYNRHRTSFGLALTLYAFFSFWIIMTIQSQLPDSILLLILGHFFLGTIFGIDAYREAVRTAQTQENAQ